jgi:hypothetical protein
MLQAACTDEHGHSPLDSLFQSLLDLHLYYIVHTTYYGPHQYMLHLHFELSAHKIDLHHINLQFAKNQHAQFMKAKANGTSIHVT